MLYRFAKHLLTIGNEKKLSHKHMTMQNEDKANEIVLVMNIADACFLLGMMDVPLGCFLWKINL